MAIIKCKMCGGDMALAADKTFGTCEFCGSTMTLPRIDDDQRAAAFNRGNHFRRIGEFDKALAVYERIVREDDTDAEAHWCCALCRFGIEYVEDPGTLEFLPTCHRASFDSFLEDVDYLAAVEHSDGITKRQYQKDAAKIAEVQRGILATSQNEEPFDVFLCYKETDENGERTRDSLMAQEVYYQLTEQGYRVFFARITLEDMVGKQYEPYIFAALNSAKVMIVIGTKPEYMNAVWVKNEWSRFLAMMKKDRHKLLLPCYRDMDPYDMPEQLAVLQSYDMAKIGFLQDLTRGIKKVLDGEKKPETVHETVTIQQTNTNIVALLKRGNMALEDSEWDKADQFFEEVLNQDAECAEAYLGKLMAELRVKKQEALKNCANPFDGRKNYQKVLRFGDAGLKNAMTDYIRHINARNEAERLEGIYSHAGSIMAQARTESDYQKAAELFDAISDYKDASAQAKKCREQAEAVRVENERKAELARKDAIYQKAKGVMAKRVVNVVEYQSAIAEFKKIPGWKDADQQIEICLQRIEELKAKAEADRLERERRAELARVAEAEATLKRTKRNMILAILAAVIAVTGILAYLFVTVWIPDSNYNAAYALMEQGKYEEAIDAFTALNGYKDSNAQITACKAEILKREYDAAYALMEQGKYEEAIDAFTALKGYKDSASQIAACEEGILKRKYDAGMALLQAGKFQEAYDAFAALGNYSDSAEQCKEARYQQAMIHWNKQEYEISNPIFEKLGTYKDSKQKIHTHKYSKEILTAPGCETKGEEKLTCENCPHTYTQAINATGHSYGTMKVTKAATCTEQGSGEKTCATCGAKKTETISALGHNYTAATCTAAQKCTRCGGTSGSALGHSSSAATCTTPAVCSRCGTTTASALGHSDNGKSRCSRCNANLTPKLSVTLTGETTYMMYETIKWAPAGDANYRMTVKVLEVMPNDNQFADFMFHVEYDYYGIEKENVKAGDVFTYEFYVYDHVAETHKTVKWKAENCVILLTIEPI